MAEITVIGPDGTRFTFPEGTDRETMLNAMRRRYTGENRRAREMIMTSQLPDPALQGVRDYLERDQLRQDIGERRAQAQTQEAAGPENIAKERFYTGAQGYTLGAAPLLQGAINVPLAAAIYPFLTEEERAGRDLGQFVSEMSSLGYDQARGNIDRARESRPLESAGLELAGGFLTGKTVYDELGKRFLAQRAGARGAAVGAGAGAQYGFLEGEGDIGQGIEGALIGAPVGAGLAKTFEAAAGPLGRMFGGERPASKGPTQSAEMSVNRIPESEFQVDTRGWTVSRSEFMGEEVADVYDSAGNLVNIHPFSAGLRDVDVIREIADATRPSALSPGANDVPVSDADIEAVTRALRNFFDAPPTDVAPSPKAPSLSDRIRNRWGVDDEPPSNMGPSGNAFAQSLLGGAGGSAYGSMNDINQDGVIDQQDILLGGAAGTVGLPVGASLARRASKAFARQPQAPARAPSNPDRDRLLQSLQDPRMFEGDPVANARMLDNWQPPAEQQVRPMGFVGGTPKSGVYQMEPQDFGIDTRGWSVERGFYDGEEFAKVVDAKGEKMGLVPFTAGKKDADVIAEMASVKKPPATRYPANDTPEKEELAAAIGRVLTEQTPGDVEYIAPKAGTPSDRARNRWGSDDEPPTSAMGFGDDMMNTALLGGLTASVLAAREQMMQGNPAPSEPQPPQGPMFPASAPQNAAARLMAPEPPPLSMDQADNPLFFGVEDFDDLPPDDPIRDPWFRRAMIQRAMREQAFQASQR